MKTMMYRRKWFFIIPLIFVAIIAFGFVTMALWNALLPEIFNLPVINFWQAAGLLILARLFFGSGHSKWRGNSNHLNSEFRNKIKNMTPEEKKEFFRNMHYHRNNWHRECSDKKEYSTNEKSVE